MEFPVRCFTCGTVVGHLHGQYQAMLKEKKPEEALDSLGVTRYCCRRMFMAYVDMIPQIIKYPRV